MKAFSFKFPISHLRQMSPSNPRQSLQKVELDLVRLKNMGGFKDGDISDERPSNAFPHHSLEILSKSYFEIGALMKQLKIFRRGSVDEIGSFRKYCKALCTHESKSNNSLSFKIRFFSCLARERSSWSFLDFLN
mgnify:CR=1 FL=1